MFTGLIEEVGRVERIDVDGERARLSIHAPTVSSDLPIGASVAVNGVCLTAVEVRADAFDVDVMRETLRATALGRLAPGDRLNLERALRLDARLGGHLVQGHVDAVGTVLDVETVPGTTTLTVGIPEELGPYVVPKGSLCVSGVSLTIAGLDGEAARIGIIPHTLAETNLADLTIGDPVNIEVDVIAKYVRQMLEKE